MDQQGHLDAIVEYASLQAPAKHLTVVPDGGRRAAFEQPQRLAGVLDEVLAQTAGRTR